MPNSFPVPKKSEKNVESWGIMWPWALPCVKKPARIFRQIEQWNLSTNTMDECVPLENFSAERTFPFHFPQEQRCIFIKECGDSAKKKNGTVIFRAVRWKQEKRNICNGIPSYKWKALLICKYTQHPTSSQGTSALKMRRCPGARLKGYQRPPLRHKTSNCATPFSKS